jgi:enoyl-CoA hydratase/carnithine racemase
MSNVLLTENRAAVRILTMNRPEKRNALNSELTQALLDALKAADADESVGCVVLTGAGAGFCAGADLSEFKDLTPENQNRIDARADLTMNLNLSFSRMSKPVVAAVNGAAMGGGAALALAADMVIMAEDAKLAYPELKHGIVAAIAMANLVRQVGRKGAFELVATGHPIGAERALQLGLVNQVVPQQVVLSEAENLAEHLAALSRTAMAATKQLFHEVADLPLTEALERGREMNKRMRSFGKTEK